MFHEEIDEGLHVLSRQLSTTAQADGHPNHNSLSPMQPGKIDKPACILVRIVAPGDDL